MGTEIAALEMEEKVETEEEKDAKKVSSEEMVEEEEEEVSPVEQVRLVVPTTDDPSLPVCTFRMWVIGTLSCALLSFLNQFFSYRTEPLVIAQIMAQVAALPLGHFLAKVFPTTQYSIGAWKFSLNPGPLNVKEHVLISIFAPGRVRLQYRERLRRRDCRHYQGSVPPTGDVILYNPLM